MNGERRELEPRVAQVLVALASARPAVVSRDRLIDQCWDGRIVGDDAINRCIVALRHLAKEFSPEPFAIETVPRVGYSLVERAGEQCQPPPDGRCSAEDRGRRAASSLAHCRRGSLSPGPGSDAAQAAPASIAVLPFRNLSSGDPYFAEGIGEEILGQLSREPQFRVAGRASSSASSGSDADARDVARRLNVDYVWKAASARQGDRVRVNADLVRASDGIRLWSDSYDGKLDDIFAIQQRIGGAIAGALRRKLIRTPALVGTAGHQRRSVQSLFDRARPDQDPQQGRLRDLLQFASRRDQARSQLCSGLGKPRGVDFSRGLTRRHRRLDRRAAESRTVCAPCAPAGARPGRSAPRPGLASALRLSRSARLICRRAVELDPNSAEALIGLGSALAAAGEFDAEMAAVQAGAASSTPCGSGRPDSWQSGSPRRGGASEAEAIGTAGFANNESQPAIILGRIAWIFGDFSEAARQWSITARANSPRWSPRARMGVADVRMIVGIDRLRRATSRVCHRASAGRRADRVRLPRRRRGRGTIAMRQRPTSIATTTIWRPS